MGLIVHGNDINGLSEKIVFGKWAILDNERGQERHGNLMVFLKEILFRTIWNKNGMVSS